MSRPVPHIGQTMQQKRALAQAAKLALAQAMECAA